MDSVVRRQAEEVFQAAADLPPDSRAEFIEKRCADQPEVKEEVVSLLEHFECDPIESLQSVCSEPIDEHEQLPRNIGPYRLLQLIGEGGFGAVYMAEQEEPVRRRVALKLIKLGMDTRQVIARFEAERQALAMMDHPNIARVLDAGATETGRPYFVMELVKGIPITEYCDECKLTTRERLELFQKVCRAVQHAHQKGIIHRDIKPSNVLVTLHDGTPVPKVIDFGIAKATRQRLTDKTLFTEFLQFIGTPQYMSPEQAAMSGIDVDTRTDIYSLGVLLYELLTGTTPFEPEVLKKADYTEIQRLIREQDPPTPSKRLSTLNGKLARIAGARCVEPKSLGKIIRGDLDWIVMRALEKDRTRRYETAAAMATDVENYLSNDVVSAGPPTATYRLRKFIRRNRLAFIVGSVVLAALFSGLALATVGLVRASTDRDRALAAESRAYEEAENARAEADAAKAITAFFNEMLTSVDPTQVRLLSAYSHDEATTVQSTGSLHRDISLDEMVRQAASRLDDEFPSKPALEAASRETLGMTLRGLGRFAEAEPQLRRALELRRNVLGERDPATLRSLLALGELLRDSGECEKAEQLVNSAYLGMKEVYGESHPKTLSCASIMASVLSDLGRFTKSNEIFRGTLDIQRESLGSKHRDTLNTMWLWSSSCLSQWDLTQGESLARELHEIASETLHPDDSLNILSKPLMAWCYLAQLQFDKAEQLLLPGIENCQRIFGEDHPFTCMAMHGLARALQGADRQQEKQHLYLKALNGLRRTRGRLHRHTLKATKDYAQWLDRKGRHPEAEQLYRDLVADHKEALGETCPETLNSMLILAGFLERTGQIDAAISVMRERVAIHKRQADRNMIQDSSNALANLLIGTGREDEASIVTASLLDSLAEYALSAPNDYSVLNNYAWELLICQPVSFRDPEKALKIAKRAVSLSKESKPAVLDTLALAYFASGDVANAVETQRKSVAMLSESENTQVVYPANLVRYLLALGEREQAEEAIMEGIARFKEEVGEDDTVLAISLANTAAFLSQNGHFAMAEKLYEESIERYRTLLGPEHEQIAQTLVRLGVLHELQGRTKEALDEYSEALDIQLQLLGLDDINTASTMSRLASVEFGLGQPAKAADKFQTVREIYDRLGVINSVAVVTTRRDHGVALVYTDRFEEAAPLLRTSIEELNSLYGPGSLHTIVAREALGILLTKTGNLAEAEEVLRNCLAELEGRHLPDVYSWYPEDAKSMLGYCLVQQGRFEEAETLLVESLPAIERHNGTTSMSVTEARRSIVELYEKWGKPELADKWRQTPSADLPTPEADVPADGTTFVED